MAETITFDFVRKIQMEEKASTKLAEIPENFYELAKNYLQKKEEVKDVEKLGEIRNIKRILEDIFNRRERKILNFAIIAARTGMVPENLTKEEQKFFDQIVEMLKKRRKEILEPLLKSKAKKERVLVFKQDVPAFVGSDGKEYGPFSKGDIAKIPEENAQLMVAQGIAEWVEIES